MSQDLAKPGGRLLGVDFGTRRVGLAVSDADRRIAVPFTVVDRSRNPFDAGYFQQLIAQEEITGIVMGLPVHMHGEEGKSAQQAREYGAWLKRVTGLPIYFSDERLTSAQAETLMQEAGLKAKQRKERLDMVAAQIMLQTFLDAGEGKKP
jgi:putative Holliday junction resolvase